MIVSRPKSKSGVSGYTKLSPTEFFQVAEGAAQHHSDIVSAVSPTSILIAGAAGYKSSCVVAGLADVTAVTSATCRFAWVWLCMQCAN